jgi:uncharacterized protein YukE
MHDENAGTAQDVAIEVSFEKMRELARDLRELARQLADRSVFVHSEALDHDLRGQLRHVENEWSAHRSELQSFLSETATTIERIVAEYEKTNDTLAVAATSR